MKLSYIFRYVWNDLWHSSNRPFSFMNILAIGISVTTLVLLSGGLLAFRHNGTKAMDHLGLRIEVATKSQDPFTKKQRAFLQTLPHLKSIHWWKPTLFLFYNKQGRLYDGIGGRTVGLDDPLLKSLKDLRSQKKVQFLSKSKTKKNYTDEIGLIVPFTMLKQLSYLPPIADSEKKATWEKILFPKQLKIRVREERKGASPMDVYLPVIGVVSGFEEGRYLITRECYQILGPGWRNDLAPFLYDRNGNALSSAKEKGKKFALPIDLPDTHVSIYIKDRKQLMATLRAVRSKGLKADCALEHYLKDYQQQQTFFLVTAGGICFALFLFAGVTLFATFYALVLRKMQEIGILKAYGASRFLITVIFSLQAMALGFIAIIVGIDCGITAGNWMSKIIQTKLGTTTKWFLLPEQYLLAILGFGVLFCFVVTFIPIRLASNLDPDKAIRG